ncbi:transcriptional regulator, BadM/Rrf2 family [Desulfovibrio sp. X2]|uniref:RrF2 family transcriptional regulator n=1 Tax=Desulfovibrio sp. X2 TaxID=941449 RepID=UPI0003588906|nr:Rrf2 family transcriptional regulator [Desulfovibrio sp. X2]EPR39990.1 transcriptional regulator, BadM/Rrf2 family [Desulfovibrio sp. X2]
MKLSTRSRYGTRMLLDIALHSGEGPVTVMEISERTDLPVKYLEKLVRLLKKGKYIKSKRGPKGGHVLAKDPAEITMGAIVRDLEGGLSLTECVAGRNDCPKMPTCITRRVWAVATEAMLRELDNITLGDLMAEARDVNCQL